ncbi:Uncharacterized conserved protein, contains ParB-like and HNH nuclease domains [Pseudomonas linyingensis]|uniref:Uncharacterized conserved protein, contains ParB-like and HNH nuclease domains n=1 Tax=Pseudomonas linyingensis TaxID=915471 RepID=A0A1H6YVF9_9PSED|nr:DUF262 domain-containing protein [Pseudomonas linyingensis]SEJ41250.1 Uncharacterized conserved protein, contains ParB-like and HNH nuclease domains [Pseudomonas linyingensis]
MEANSRPLMRIFEPTVCYQIPLFQRPYVWRREGNWQPLWDDLERLLGLALAGQKLRPHFLGAVVLEQLYNDTGWVQLRQVIDGQQRFTTLQLLLIAVRDLCMSLDSKRYYERFDSLVSNRAALVDSPEEICKLLPTNFDRKAYAQVHRAGSPEVLLAQLQREGEVVDGEQGIVGAYLYFHEQLGGWLQQPVEDRPRVELEERLEALWAVVQKGLQFVLIELGEHDEAQVIFETLNARGTQLLPADLIKNLLFRRAQAEGEDIDRLYQAHWAAFDGEFWREEIKQGRESRPRIDIFIRHFLTLAMRRDIRFVHIFNEYKNYVQYTDDWRSCLIGEAATAREHMALLGSYAEHFREFSSPAPDSRLARFLNRLDAVDTSTIYPLLLLCSQQLRPQQEDEFEAILTVIESFLFRRMICGLTSKNYNRPFLDLIRHLEREGTISARAVEQFLLASEGESARFPTDAELKRAILDHPLYQWWPQYRVRAVLEALDAALGNGVSAAGEQPSALAIEHILPQKWDEHWPVPKALQKNPQGKQAFTEQRDRLKHTLGNLTLVAGSLGPALSRSPWEAKKAELLRCSQPNLSRELHDAEAWSEQEILARGQTLAVAACMLWPYPAAEQEVS